MKRDFLALFNCQFDLLVCGGGVYGAWTAYDAALRGLKVAIVEQSDWANATSSASSKLIHGGLRYLETYDFKLVKKALHERQMLLDMAPHRVWPLRFGVPIYKDSRIGKFRMMAGLALYDFLAGNLNTMMGYQHFDAQAFATQFPFLDSGNLQSGFTYTDAQTDDARLVLELIDGAVKAGAVCVNYCKLTAFIESDGYAYGAKVEDQISGEIGQVNARQCVNTIGQWTTTSPEDRSWCRLSKGVHLLLPATLGQEALLLTAQSDGRVFFAIPWYGLTLIGTTDTAYHGNVDHVAVEKADVDYLLAEANHYFRITWTEADIISSYAGLRVIKHDHNSFSTSTSRDWRLKTTRNGVHYSIGGKLTSAREDASHIVDTVCAQLGINAQCPTYGMKFPWAPDGTYSEWLSAANAEAYKLGIDEESAKWLVRRHGKRVDEIFRIINKETLMAERIIPSLPFIQADLLLCARNEMVVHLSDLLRRRIPILLLSKLGDDDFRRIANSVAATLGWDELTIDFEIKSCRLGYA